jgi:hypothetical protein
MTNKFPQLNLEKFANSYQSFYEATFKILEEAETNDVIKYVLTDDINSQYKYSDKKRKGYPIMSFLKETYLTGEQEIFLSFFNEILPNIFRCIKKEEWQLNWVDVDLRSHLLRTMYKFLDLLVKTNNPSVFNLNFYFDKDNSDFRRKLDEVTTESINSNIDNLDGDNKVRYQECVSDFLLYKKDAIKDNKLFYNESLNNLKKVIENTLQNNYKKTGGTFPKIHKKKELSNILFDDSNVDFENFINYVVKNVHHEEGGQPKIFTEKEYTYLWLELNNILYLLNKYKI